MSDRRPFISPIWIFAPVFLALMWAAVVGLPLFQDGSSYLFELLLTDSAIRHHRLSVLLVQVPARLVGEALTSVSMEAPRRAQWVRIAFTLSYAMVPLCALALSWLVVRRRADALFVWAALIILFVNLVNFSGVSELLMAIQLCCPLLLVSVVAPGTRRYWLTTIVLLPIVFLMHPLTAPLFLAIALGTALVGRHDVERQRAAHASAILYLVTTALRVVASFVGMTPYVASFLAPDAMTEYFLVTSWENAVVLLSGLAIGVVCWRAKVVATTESRMAQLYVACMAVAVAAGGVLLWQYLFGARHFPLKTGLTLFTVLPLMLLAAWDRLRPTSACETMQRLRLVTVLAVVFAVVTLGKAVLWQTAVDKLAHTLSASSEACVERGSDDFAWLQEVPYGIIDNWALPSLALVMQNLRPSTLLLDAGDCRRFHDTGMVQVDPWTLLPLRTIVR